MYDLVAYTVVAEMSPTASSQLDSGGQPCDILTLGRGRRHDCTTEQKTNRCMVMA